MLAVAGHGSLGRQRGDTAGHGSIGEVAADVAVNKTARAILRRISTKLTGTVRPSPSLPSSVDTREQCGRSAREEGLPPPTIASGAPPPIAAAQVRTLLA